MNIRLAYHPEGDRTLSSAFPHVRLAYNPGPVNAYNALTPDIRLAVPVHSGATGPDNLVQALGPTVRLAHVPGTQGDNSLLGQKSVDQIPIELRPALLVSYVYLEPFLKNRHRYAYRDWALDSGAFSAHQSGTTIDLQAYIEKCKELMATDPTLTEIFALDVIGEWKPTLRNTEKMWEVGIQAIPTYHVDEPEEYLKHIAAHYPKIALGGIALAKARKKTDWATQCFSRVWPKKIHGFGFGGKLAILSLPFHSVDATNWELGACKYGRWQHFGKMSVRGSKQNLRAEVEFYLKLEQQARRRWHKEMELLGGDVMVRLAEGRSGRYDEKAKAFHGEQG